MSTKRILRWARGVRINNGPAKHLLLVLATHSDNEGLLSPGPSWATLSQETTLSRTTIYKALKVLEAAGLIIKADRERANGSRTSCEYLLAVADADRQPVHETNWYRFTTRTGTGSRDEPVHETNGSTRSSRERVLNSANAGTRSRDEPPRSPGEPPEEKIATTAASSYARDAHTHAHDARAREASIGHRNGRGPRAELERLSATATGKDAYVLVAKWRTSHHTQLPQDFYDQVTQAVQRLLDDKDLKADPTLIRQALTKLDRRSDAGPGLLRGFYTDMVRDRNDRLARPAFDQYGTPQRPLEEITDEDLTRSVLDLILGQDHWYAQGECPPDIVEESGPRYVAWMKEAGEKRLVERRLAARESLARQQQRAT